VQDDLVERAGVKALAGQASPEDTHVLVVGELLGGAHGLLDPARHEADSRVGVLSRPVGEHEDVAVPLAVVDPVDAVPAFRGELIPAPARHDRADPAHRLLAQRSRLAVCERPIH
jgi:hypothetical protein